MCVLKPAVYDALPLALVLDRLTIIAPKKKCIQILFCTINILDIFTDIVAVIVSECGL